VQTLVSRLDDRVLVPVDIDGPAVVTLAPSGRAVAPVGSAATIAPLPGMEDAGPAHPSDAHRDPQLIALLEPDLHTMDLWDAVRVLSGGAGLAAGLDDHQATGMFAVLGEVAAALGGSAGATRVATDAGWTGYERQIGTTGVTIDPELYVAFGISGAAQHIGGLGAPRHIVSVNTDGSSPMTAMADLGLVTDAKALLLELALRLGVDVPADLRTADHSGVPSV
jgi:electron transfer flavoprotein alpha subunit